VSLGLSDTWPRITSNYDMPLKKEVCYDHLLTKIRYISSFFDLPRSMKDLKCHLFEVLEFALQQNMHFPTIIGLGS
jgi:hypothetical protein